MNLEYRSILPPEFAPESRVWIYQASRLLSISEALELEEMLQAFSAAWTSHGAAVKGFASLFFGRFIVLMADETATGVSGCSTDSSVRLMKAVEQKFNVNLFDRQTLAFVRKNQVELLPLTQFRYALDNGFIDQDTLYFNNLVQTKAELEHSWLVPVKQSWLKTRLPVAS